MSDGPGFTGIASGLGTPAVNALITAGALTTLARTAIGGYAKVNGTGTFLTWTAPNDGNMHPFIVAVSQFVTAPETGGAISVVYTFGGHASGPVNVFTGGDAAGVHPGADTALSAFIADPGTTVTVQQTSALTAGGPSTVWAAILGQ